MSRFAGRACHVQDIFSPLVEYFLWPTLSATKPIPVYGATIYVVLLWDPDPYAEICALVFVQYKISW